MSDFIKFSLPTMAHEAVEGLKEARRMARSLEATIDALIPVIDRKEVADELEVIRENAMKASEVLRRIYSRNAKETFGPGGNVLNLGAPYPAAISEEKV